ncbi:MAG: hypothetical protein K2P99_04755 [Burkholderiales bacterium]|nr:hypothetical protein [Burkholderiales bacterium]
MFQNSYQNLTVDIIVDDFPIHPRENSENLGQIYALHKRYQFSEIKLDNSQCNSWQDEYSLIRKELDIALILPLYLYDHSGLAISLTPFSCRWDSGQLGYIFVTKKRLREFFDCRRISRNYLEKARKSLDLEVAEYNLYLQHEVYNVAVLDNTKQILDSCFGIYGYQNAQAIGEKMKQSLIRKCA